MTTLLERAFTVASNLPEIEQDALAKWIIVELESEQRWSLLFENSQDLLAELAQEALQESDAARDQPLDPDAL